jgi:hypothetical protein
MKCKNGIKLNNRFAKPTAKSCSDGFFYRKKGFFPAGSEIHSEVKRMHRGDGFVIFLIVAVVVIWGILWLRRGWSMPLNRAMLPAEGKVPDDDTVHLLESSGYEVISGKKRVPVQMVVNDEEELQSRFFIDYFARSAADRRLYAVKLAKDRKPLEMTGSAIRETLLPYYLLFHELDGVLYVDMKQRSVTCIHFEIED